MVCLCAREQSSKNCSRNIYIVYLLSLKVPKAGENEAFQGDFESFARDGGTTRLFYRFVLLIQAVSFTQNIEYISVYLRV